MRNNDDVFRYVFSGGRASKGMGEGTFNTAKYIHDSKGKDLDSVAHEYIQANGTKNTMKKFIRRIGEAVGDLIAQEGIDGQILESKHNILKMAEERQIPLKSWAYDDVLDPNKWFYSELKLQGVDDVASAKESLRFVNCLLEVYSGEHFLREENQQASILHNDNTQTLHQVQDNQVSLDDSQRQKLEEEIIYNLWEQGFLKCDRDR